MSILLCDQKLDLDKGRSSCPKVFYKKGALKNFLKFTWKTTVSESLFNKVAGKTCICIKKQTLAQMLSYDF